MTPVLLLIPGMFNTTAVWDGVRAQLGEGIDVYVADVTAQDSIAAMADDAWRIVEALPPAAPLVVAGFSMGGYVLAELLARHAERIGAVAFVATSARAETAGSLANREKTIAALERQFGRTVEGIIPFGLHPQHHARADIVDGLRAMMHAVGAATAIRQTRAIAARGEHRAMLARLRLPALVVCGREDKVTPPAMSEDLAALLPHARTLWLEHAGHNVPLEQPAALADALRRLVSDAVATPAPQDNHKETPR